MATTRNQKELERRLAELRTVNERIGSFPKDLKPNMVGVALINAQRQ